MTWQQKGSSGEILSPKESGDSSHTSIDGYPHSTQTFNQVTLPSEFPSPHRVDAADQMNKAALDAVRTVLTSQHLFTLLI